MSFLLCVFFTSLSFCCCFSSFNLNVVDLVSRKIALRGFQFLPPLTPHSFPSILQYIYNVSIRIFGRPKTDTAAVVHSSKIALFFVNQLSTLVKSFVKESSDHLPVALEAGGYLVEALYVRDVAMGSFLKVSNSFTSTVINPLVSAALVNLQSASVALIDKQRWLLALRDGVGRTTASSSSSANKRKSPGGGVSPPRVTSSQLSPTARLGLINLIVFRLFSPPDSSSSSSNGSPSLHSLKHLQPLVPWLVEHILPFVRDSLRQSAVFALQPKALLQHMSILVTTKRMKEKKGLGQNSQMGHQPSQTTLQLPSITSMVVPAYILRDCVNAARCVARQCCRSHSLFEKLEEHLWSLLTTSHSLVSIYTALFWSSALQEMNEVTESSVIGSLLEYLSISKNETAAANVSQVLSVSMPQLRSKARLVIMSRFFEEPLRAFSPFCTVLSAAASCGIFGGSPAAAQQLYSDLVSDVRATISLAVPSTDDDLSMMDVYVSSLEHLAAVFHPHHHEVCVPVCGRL